MVGYIKESAGDFKITPEGQHIMVCCRVIDLGTQKTEFQGETKDQRKVLIGWELPGERVSVNGEDLPMIHYAKYTWSFHEKANLRRDLEAWRGKRFKEEDFSGPPNGFHIKNLIGVPCYGQIVHDTGGNGKTYANLASIMAFPGKRDDWPRVEGKPIFFDLDEFDADAFADVPEYWQGVIKASPEYGALFGTRHDERNPPPRTDLDDDIPF